MSLLGALAKAADLALGAVQLGTSIYERARKLWKGQPPTPPESTPLTWRDVAHQQEQIRSATTKKP